MTNSALALPDDFAPTDKQRHRWERAIANAEGRFLELADTGLDYNAERAFAFQLLSNPKNDYAMSVAEKNPMSLLLAMVNLAATGLTLNPAHAYAYLVPRDGAIKLDISYRGFIKIATDSGAVLWAKADLVYERDTFVYRGPTEKPDVEADPFGNRGAIRGAYCLAKTADGSFLCDTMSLEDLLHVRDTYSEYYIRQKKGPWKDEPEEMMKKTVLRRARKTWPNSTGSERLDRAIEISNESEGNVVNAHLRLAGSPNDGVWEAVDQATQIELERIAASLNDFHEAGDMAGAFDYLEKQRLDTDETAALHTRLDSKVRSALKKERQSRRAA